MAVLTNKTISNFVSILNSSDTDSDANPILYGKCVVQNGSKYVQINGSDILTPVDDINTEIEDGDEVSLVIKDHSVVIVGNLTMPASARTAEYVIDESGNKALITSSDIISLLKDNNLELTSLVADRATIANLVAKNANVLELVVGKETVEKLKAGEIEVDDLTAGRISANTADIDKVWIDELLVKSGSFTEDVGIVKLNADVIDANTIAVDKLILKNGESAKKSTDITQSDLTNAGVTDAEMDLVVYAINRLSESGLSVTKANLLALTEINTDGVATSIISDELADKIVNASNANNIVYQINSLTGALERTTATESEVEQMLDGTALVADSVTTRELKVSQIFADEAVVNAITSNCITTDEITMKEAIIKGLQASMYLDYDDSTSTLLVHKEGDENNAIAISEDTINILHQGIPAVTLGEYTVYGDIFSSTYVMITSSTIQAFNGIVRAVDPGTDGCTEISGAGVTVEGGYLYIGPDLSIPASDAYFIAKYDFAVFDVDDNVLLGTGVDAEGKSFVEMNSPLQIDESVTITSGNHLIVSNETGTGSATITSGNGTISSGGVTYTRHNNVVTIRVTVKFSSSTTSKTTSAGSNLVVCTLSGIPKPAATAKLIDYYGSALLVGHLTTSGSLTVRVLCSSVSGTSSTTATLVGTYIATPYNE